MLSVLTTIEKKDISLKKKTVQVIMSMYCLLLIFLEILHIHIKI